MEQIKLFQEKTPDLAKFEAQVNTFLKDNEGKILVKDIKYNAISPNPNNSSWMIWTAMVRYEVLKP